MEDLVAGRLAGEDVAEGQPQVSYEPIRPAGHSDGDVKFGRSLRVPMAMFARISAAAEQRQTSWSALLREWIAEGLARSAEAEVDPEVELHHRLDAATRTLRTLEGQRDAA